MTDGLTNMSKLTVAFRNFANGLKTLAEVLIPRHGYNIFPSVCTGRKQDNEDFLNCDIY